MSIIVLWRRLCAHFMISRFVRCCHCQMPRNPLHPERDVSLTYKRDPGGETEALSFLCTVCWPRTTPQQRFSYLLDLLASWCAQDAITQEQAGEIIAAIAPQLGGQLRFDS